MSAIPPPSVPKWKCTTCKHEIRGQMCQLKKCSNCGDLDTMEMVH